MSRHICPFFHVLMMFFTYTMFCQVASVNTLTEPDQKKAIDTLISTLEKVYVSSEVAQKMKHELLSNYHAGKYKSATNPFIFADYINLDLLKISEDKHIRYRYKWPTIKEHTPSKETKVEEERAAIDNFGFKEAKILEGNLGYLKLTRFEEPRFGSKVAVAALNLVWNTNAIIFDLRNNFGGDASMVAFIISRFLEDKPLVISTTYLKKYGALHASNALEGPTIPRLPSLDVYVLVSNQTYSAAEEFAFVLQNLKRAVIIGEPTAGAANPVEQFDLGLFTANITTGITMDPNTNTSWEKKGVIPDVLSHPEEALLVAQKMAIQKQVLQYPERIEYAWILNRLKTKSNPDLSEPKALSKFAGRYQTCELVIENGFLYLITLGHIKTKLLPLEKSVFYTETYQHELRFLYTNSTISGVKITSASGKVVEYSKD